MIQLIKTAFLSAISTLVISGCLTEEPKEGFQTEKEAAVAFFKDNITVLKELTSKQELLGWVLLCSDGKYRYSDYRIGGLINYRYRSRVETSDCKVSASIHTHPTVPLGKTVDFFSKADMKTSFAWNSYLLSQENCNVRFGSKLKHREGVLLGRLSECK